MGMLGRFISWAQDRDKYGPQPVVTFDGRPLFDRYAPFWQDEFRGRWPMPWWRHFNVFLHHWKNGEGDAFHDHPRWSITICLCGSIIERTPWGERLLTPGSVVFRSRKAIHAFKLQPGSEGNTWTLFIVGRRKHVQNSYVVNSRGYRGSGMKEPHP